jgi:hypothetical protein
MYLQSGSGHVSLSPVHTGDVDESRGMAATHATVPTPVVVVGSRWIFDIFYLLVNHPPYNIPLLFVYHVL